MNNFFKAYSAYLNALNIRHQTLNYSWTSNGMKHPNSPVGVLVKDTGQVQIYAGKTQSIWSLKGERLELSTVYHNIAQKITFTTKGITNFRILGKHFVKEIFEGQKVLAIKPDVNINSYGLIGPQTQIISPAGPCTITNLVMLDKIFDERMIFDLDPNDKNLLPPKVEIARLVKSLLGD